VGSQRHGVPLELAVRLRNALKLNAAVETGTYRGDSARALAGVFEHVHTIELSPELHEQARQAAPPNITFHLGDSATVLGEVLASADEPLLFWLDGHWSGGPTAGADNECPVMAEIAAIDGYALAAGSVILIDDARLFLSPPPPPHRREQWPGFLEVVDLLRQAHERYVTMLEDVIIAVPASARRVVEDYALENGLSSVGAPCADSAPSQGLLRWPRLTARRAGLRR
jgi:hypothetical protein